MLLGGLYIIFVLLNMVGIYYLNKYFLPIGWFKKINLSFGIMISLLSVTISFFLLILIIFLLITNTGFYNEMNEKFICNDNKELESV